MAYLSKPFHWYGADWTVLLHRYNGDLCGSDCYVGVDNTSALPADFEFRGKARMRLLLEDGKTPARGRSISATEADPWCNLNVFHNPEGDRADQGWGRFIQASDVAKLETFQAARKDLSEIEVHEAKHVVYIEVTLEREFRVTRLNIMHYDSKEETGMVGITNQGATCYLNALLQMLFI